MKPLALSLVMLSVLAGCDDDKKKWPKPVVHSASVSDEQVHMSVYAITDETETDVQVYLHRHRSNGVDQFLKLSGDDELALTDGSWEGAFEYHLVSGLFEPWMAYYSSIYSETAADTLLWVDFLREGAVLRNAELSLLSSTELTVESSGGDTLSLDDTVSASWTALDSYRYELKFTFKCDYQGREIGFHRHFPSYSGGDLASPFDLDLSQYRAPPSGSSNCSVTTSLISEQEQTAEAGSDIAVDIMVARSTSVEMPLEVAEPNGIRLPLPPLPGQNIWEPL